MSSRKTKTEEKTTASPIVSLAADPEGVVKMPVVPTEEPVVTEESVLRNDGPTLEEFMAAGYHAEAYPPQGYAPKESAGMTAFKAGDAEVFGALVGAARKRRELADGAEARALAAKKQAELDAKEAPHGRDILGNPCAPSILFKPSKGILG